ncbi:MAG: peptide chain release factor 2, partial [Myxococcota bacterium]
RGPQSQKVATRFASLKSRIEPIEELESELGELTTLLELAEEEADKETTQEVVSNLEAMEERLGNMEFQAMLSGEHDEYDVFLTIQAGAGGTDSCDWARMLLRMYRRYLEDNGYTVDLVDSLAAEEAGIRHGTIDVKGKWAYGYLKGERGVHRLVRNSPFDAAHRRQTSFVAVEVTPQYEVEEIEIDSSDLRIDTYRASGAGGQHVNTTDSAVRITHQPSGVVVTCQNERSQHRNRATAMKMLASRLAERQQAERNAALDANREARGEIAWGNQIRSYVLSPYQMVKDHRTGVETGNVNAILEGEIHPFVEAFLKGVKPSK